MAELQSSYRYPVNRERSQHARKAIRLRALARLAVHQREITPRKRWAFVLISKSREKSRTGAKTERKVRKNGSKNLSPQTV